MNRGRKKKKKRDKNKKCNNWNKITISIFQTHLAIIYTIQDVLLVNTKKRVEFMFVHKTLKKKKKSNWQ